MYVFPLQPIEIEPGMSLSNALINTKTVSFTKYESYIPYSNVIFCICCEIEDMRKFYR